MHSQNRSDLGYDELTAEAGADLLPDGVSPARVTEVNKNNYRVSDGSHDMKAELSGKFLFTAEEKIDYPTVGDWVAVQALNDFTLAVIHSVFPRKTLLKRKDPGKRIEFQPIAANIDFGLIVQSADRPNTNLLDRYLVMLNDAGIHPVVVVTKIDLVSTSEVEVLKERLSGSRCRVLFISNTIEGGTDALSEMLISGKTYCLLGQSGVGKSSLLNRVSGSFALEVGEVREQDGRGRHTTVRRQLVHLDSGAIFIDTPGIRELGNFDVDEGLEHTFEDFSSYARQCRFSDCTHTHEQGCAIIAALEAGDIEEERYRNFLKLRKESEFHDLSYRERRRKDKSFGRMVKNFKKMKDRR